MIDAARAMVRHDDRRHSATAGEIPMPKAVFVGFIVAVVIAAVFAFFALLWWGAGSQP
jgi:hypothetical protein